MSDLTVTDEPMSGRRIAAQIKHRARTFVESVTSLADTVNASSVFGGSIVSLRTGNGTPLLTPTPKPRLSTQDIKDAKMEQDESKRKGPAAVLKHKLKRMVLKLRKKESFEQNAETSTVTGEGMGGAHHDHPTEVIPVTTASEVIPSAAPVTLPMHPPSIVSHRSEVPTLDSLQITDSTMDVDAIVPKPSPPPAPIDRFCPSFDSLTLSRDPAERFHQIAERYRRISQNGVGDAGRMQRSETAPEMRQATPTTTPKPRPRPRPDRPISTTAHNWYVEHTTTAENVHALPSRTPKNRQGVIEI